MFNQAYQGKRVLLTGHTGFKGAWLAEWLLGLGAKVTGLALPPATEPALFDQLGLAGRLDHRIGDIRDLATVRAVVAECQPDYVFHLAAQALVRLSYEQPVETYATNVMGTAHVLEALRLAKKPCTVIAITTDKCYENREWVHSYREEDPMGGYDPYSSSKGAAELVINAYRRSFFSAGAGGPDIRLASVRAGNVIGGGDWAADRIVPDAVRALETGKPIPVRNPAFTRPWQHVLEPLGGYLLLGAKLEAARASGDAKEIAKYASAFNFGPEPSANRTVRELVEEVLKHWPGRWEQVAQEKHLPEAPLLSLDIAKAREVLGWQPRWDFAHTVKETVMWYRAAAGAQDALAPTQMQISTYCA